MRRAATVLVGVLALAGCGAAPSSPSSPTGPAEGGGWTTLASFPLAPREHAVTAWTGSEVLVIGGYTVPCPDTADCDLPEPARDGAAFDPATNTWRRIAEAPVPLSWETPAVAGDTVYVWAAGQLLSYDASDDAWTSVPAPEPAEWNGPRLAVIDARVVLVPNERSAGQPSGIVFDPAHGTWSDLPEDPFGPAFDRTVTATPAGLVLTAKTTFPTENSTEPSFARAAVLDPATGVWRPLEDSSMLGGWMWAWTGRRMVDPSLGTTDGGAVAGYGRDIPWGGRLDPATGTWSALPEPPQAPSDGWQVEALGGVLSALSGWIYDDRSGSWTTLPRPEGAPSSPGDAVWAGDRLVVVGGLADPRTLSQGAWMWTPSSSGTVTDADLAGTWALQDGTSDGAPIPLPVQARATLAFADGQLSGTSFCNGYGASYELRGTDLVVGDVHSTLMGCADDIAAAESAYAGVLSGGRFQVTVDDTGLTLTGDHGTLHFYRLPPVPQSDLTGTRWVLDSLQEGGTATSAVGTPAVLELRDDGSATVSTGCREFEASWRAEGDSVVLGDYAYDDIGCAEPIGHQDQLLLGLLEGGFQVAVDGDTLTVSDVDAIGSAQPVATYRG
jgi:heat shock protein HslJ